MFQKVIPNKSRHRRKIGLFIVSLGLIIAALLFASAVNNSLKAEHTLHAYHLVLDITQIYCTTYPGKWPQSWDDLIEIKPTNSYAGWQWPEERESISNRINIDFDLKVDEVLAKSVKEFDAIRQLPPNYPPDPQMVERFLNAIRKAPKEN